MASKELVGLIERGSFGANLVYQHNDLIKACYDLTVTEKKLLLGCICKINSFEGITSDTPFSFDVEEAQAILGLDLSNSGAVARYRKAAKGLMKKVITTDNPHDGSWTDFTFAQTAKFDSDTKVMTIYFSVGVIPYLSNLHSQFTKYRLMHIGSLTSKYAIRLYEFLVMWIGENYGKSCVKKLEIGELDKILSSGNTSYLDTSVSMFKARVLYPAVEQINEETDISVSVKEIKTGRSISHIELSFTTKEDWKKAEIGHKVLLTETQVQKIVNNPVFFNDFYNHEFFSDRGGVGAFLDDAKKKLLADPRKHFPNYSNYLK